MANQEKHPFEAAGLGIAPFKVTGVSKCEHTSCDYCGQALRKRATITDTHDNKFSVGLDCAKKTSLKVQIKKHEKDFEARRLAARVEKAELLLDHESLNAPHPNRYRAEKGDTRRDWASWMFKNAGAAGKKQACLFVERAVRGVK